MSYEKQGSDNIQVRQISETSDSTESSQDDHLTFKFALIEYDPFPGFDVNLASIPDVVQE